MQVSTSLERVDTHHLSVGHGVHVHLLQHIRLLAPSHQRAPARHRRLDQQINIKFSFCLSLTIVGLTVRDSCQTSLTGLVNYSYTVTLS